MKRASNSSENAPLFSVLRYYYDLYKMYTRGAAKIDVVTLKDDEERMVDALRGCVGDIPDDISALEIGFGAKPHRIRYLVARGWNVYGVDLDVPILDGSISEIVQIFNKNGIARTVKSLIRFLLFDVPAKKQLISELSRISGDKFVFDNARLIVADAGDPGLWARLPIRPQIIFSFRVLEHIDRDSLEDMLSNIAKNSPDNVVIYFVITIYTGIIGNHLTEWYPHAMNESKKNSQPWEHLRQKKFKAPTYLNKMSRREYRSVFDTYFDCITDRELVPNMGIQFLTPEIKRELADYDDYELLSNDVVFVLIKKTEKRVSAVTCS